MKKIKNITLSIFAVIGFVALLSSFTNQPQGENDIVIISLLNEKFGVTYLTNNGETTRVRGEEQELVIERHLSEGYKINAITSRGAMGVTYHLIK